MDGFNLLCFCHQVTAMDVEQAVLQGVLRFADLQSRTGACTGCGSCRFDVHKCLEECKKKHFGPDVEKSDPFEGLNLGLNFFRR